MVIVTRPKRISEYCEPKQSLWQRQMVRRGAAKRYCRPQPAYAPPILKVSAAIMKIGPNIRPVEGGVSLSVIKLAAVGICINVKKMRWHRSNSLLDNVNYVNLICDSFNYRISNAFAFQRRCGLLCGCEFFRLASRTITFAFSVEIWGICHRWETSGSAMKCNPTIRYVFNRGAHSRHKVAFYANCPESWN